MEMVYGNESWNPFQKKTRRQTNQAEKENNREKTAGKTLNVKKF